MRSPIPVRVLALVASLLVITILIFFTAGQPLFSSDKSSSGGVPRAAVAAQAKPVAEPGAPATAQAGAQLRLASAVIPTAAAIVEPSPGVYVAHGGESVATLARMFIGQSKIMTVSELEQALRDANHIQGNFLKKGQAVVIPEFQEHFSSDQPFAAAKDYEVRAIYLTGLMAGSDHGIQLIRRWRQVGGNAVVFDIKDSDGSVSIPFRHELAPVRHHPPIRNLNKFVHFLHANGMRVVARMALFRDEQLVQHHPELAVRSRKSGGPWRENGKLVWTDPSQPAVQSYELALAEHVADSGVDEIQFDYVRFPAEGDQADTRFHFEAVHPAWKRSEVIADFLARAYDNLHARGVMVSLDVFGVMAWQRPVDLSHTGQDIVEMARHCDVLSPMIYPSHFFGMDGYAKPGDAPEHFIAESMDRFQKITAGTGVVLRPWLQAFAWRTKTYSPEYIRTQVSVARAHGGVGFLFWNARNDYSKPLTAMPEMRAAGLRYFRGDELPRSRPELQPAKAGQ